MVSRDDGTPVRSRFKIPLDIRFKEESDNAKFPGGNEELKKRIFDNLKVQNYKQKKSCIIFFEIDNMGKIVTMDARGKDKKFNRDVEQAVLKINEKWEPKLLNDIPVSSIFDFTFELN